MTTINRNDLRIQNAENLIKSFDVEGHNAYLFLSKPTQWETDIVATTMPRYEAGDNSPQKPDNSWKEFYSVYDEMLSMSKLTRSNAKLLLPRLRWTSGIIYDMYRHDYNEVRRTYSNATHLYDSVFYVINARREVYVCLDNNNNSQSLVEPNTTAIDSEPFYTSDGYQWLYLYTVPLSEFRENSTNNFIPVSTISMNYIPPGGVYTVVIESRGSKYTVNPDGIFNTDRDSYYYFCNIVGDGRDGIAKVKVFNNEIIEVRVISPGEGYTYAKLDFTPNRVYQNLEDLFAEENGLNPLGDNTFRSSVIITPPEGWGSESEDEFEGEVAIARQLGGTRVGLFLRTQQNEKDPDFLREIMFRQVGLIQDVEFLSTSITSTTDPNDPSVLYEVSVTDDNSETSFIPGETIYQFIDDINDPNRKYIAKGVVVDSKTTIDSYGNTTISIQYIQKPQLHTINTLLVGEKYFDYNMYEFEGDSNIIGDTSGKSCKANPDSYVTPQYKPYSGKITYLANLQPVQRDPNQTERISLIISY